jgi:predicted transposase YbfD/YdcC
MGRQYETVKKTSGVHTFEKRLYVSSLSASTPALGSLVRNHWSIESMHWSLADDDSILLSVFMQLSNKYHLEN